MGSEVSPLPLAWVLAGLAGHLAAWVGAGMGPLPLWVLEELACLLSAWMGVELSPLALAWVLEGLACLLSAWMGVKVSPLPLKKKIYVYLTNVPRGKPNYRRQFGCFCALHSRLPS